MNKMPENYRLNVPLNALRAFEAAARHLSIKDAAAELCVTPSAISHQLRGLENSLGLTLMRRVGARLELTEAGSKLSPSLTESFKKMIDAVGELKHERSNGPLRLSMLPTFAAHWFSPRLTSYPFERTGFDLLISTTQEVVDLSTGVADAAVRQGHGKWDGLRADLLFDEHVSLFGAPSLSFASLEELREGLKGRTLFLSHYRKENFDCWNSTLPGGPIRPASIMMVDSSGLALRAAMDGAGVALAGAELAAFDVSVGRLNALCSHHFDTKCGYYLVYPEIFARDRRVRNLSKWIVDAAKETRSLPLNS